MSKKISLLILAMAESVVSEMVDKGILNGFTDGTFKPNESIIK